MKKQKSRRRKPRFCDSGACDCCQYICEGDFLCDKYQEIVVSDWTPTENYLMCKQENKNGST